MFAQHGYLAQVRLPWQSHQLAGDVDVHVKGCLFSSLNCPAINGNFHAVRSYLMTILQAKRLLICNQCSSTYT